MKETAPKKTWFQTLRTLWVPLAIGVVTVAALAVVVGAVWKDYRTAMMDSQTRQMELVVQSTADSIRVLLEEYADRLDSIAEKVAADAGLRPTVARSDTIRDVWLENSSGEVGGRGYGRPSSVPERTYAPRDAESSAPVAPTRTERVDDFADFSFGKIEL